MVLFIVYESIASKKLKLEKIKPLFLAGIIAVVIAISQKADVARLAPIYNTNTILAVLMGIIFLKEIPDVSQMIRVIGGAVLIVIGAILVSI